MAIRVILAARNLRRHQKIVFWSRVYRTVATIFLLSRFLGRHTGAPAFASTVLRPPAALCRASRTCRLSSPAHGTVVRVCRSLALSRSSSEAVGNYRRPDVAVYTRPYSTRWLGSRAVSVLDSGAEGPGFKSQPRRCRVYSLRQTVHTHRASVHQAAKLVAVLLRAAGVTAGLAESNGSLPPGL